MSRRHSLDELDTVCHALGRSGELAACEARALELCERAHEVDDMALESAGWRHVARCELREPRYLDALEAARQARRLAQLAGSVDGEVDALTLCCTALTALHRLDEAIAAGTEALELAALADAALAPVQAADPLGLALAWHTLDQAAHDCFEHAVQQASQQGRTDWVAHLRIHQSCAATLHHLIERTAGTPDMRALAGLHERLEQALASCEHAPGVPSALTQRSGRFLLGWIQVLQSAWRGLGEPARQRLEALRMLVPPRHPWLSLLADLAGVEVAVTLGQSDHAEAQARALLETAQAQGHLAMAQLAAQRLGQMLLARGAATAAQTLAREQQQRLRHARLEQLHQQQRSASVEAELRRRQVAAREHEQRPGGEDGLTGLPDRREFIERTEALLDHADLQRVRCSVVLLALPGLDAIATRHGPLLRDRLLCSVAAQLRDGLRSGDLAARWTHGEFALLLHRSGAAETERVAERLCERLQTQDWSHLADGLAVQARCGTAQATSRDTALGLMRRCDEALRQQVPARDSAHMVQA